MHGKSLPHVRFSDLLMEYVMGLTGLLKSFGSSLLVSHPGWGFGRRLVGVDAESRGVLPSS
jgi:hypothetical protein